MMPATIQDVAKQAGVSTATVSRALRGLPNVSPATRDQVIGVAEKLDYQITPHISRMARGRRVVGIIVPLADQWFYSKLVSIAELELMNQDCDVVRYSVDSVAGQESLLQHLTARKLVDGLILCSLSLTDQTVEVVREADIAVATIETTHPDLPSVSIDNGAAAEMGAQYLINLGHRHIAIITGMETAPLQFSIPKCAPRWDYACTRTGRDRLQARAGTTGKLHLSGRGRSDEASLLGASTADCSLCAFG